MKKSKIPLICLCLFVGLGAVWGSFCMFNDPTGVAWGMDMLLPGLRRLPFADVLFQNLIFSGVSLLIVNGLCQITAAILLMAKHRLGVMSGVICGVLLMLWISIQFFIFEMNWLSISYFIFGALELFFGLLCLAAQRKEATAQ